MLDNLRSIFRKRRHCSEETPPPSEDPKILQSCEDDEGRPGCNDDYSVAWPEAYFNITPADRQFKFTLDQPQEMEIDAQSAQRPSENNLHRQNSFSVAHSESSMNFDYLHGLRSGTVPSTSTAASGPSDNASNNSYGLVDDSRALDRTINTNERFVNILDQIDARVEKLRKDALNLQEMKDYLLMSMDLIKSNEMLQKMRESEREEVMLYIQRVSSRLGTVELNVRTVRDNSQEDSLSQINSLIDTMIKVGDPVIARQRCQLYLNACCTSAMDPSGHLDTLYEADVGPIDKKFESALLGCTLDDQKNIKKRLQALMGYLNKQTVSH